MSSREAAPFESIEEAQQYLALLLDVVRESKSDVEADIADSASNGSEARRAEAMRVVAYKLDRLGAHLKGSLLLLNDLRSLRRLLLNERSLEIAPKPKPATDPEIAEELSYGT